MGCPRDDSPPKADTGKADVVNSLLSWLGQMSPAQYVDALLEAKTPGCEKWNRDDMIDKLDAAMSDGWSYVASQFSPVTEAARVDEAPPTPSSVDRNQ
jgi:hypothetical protein